MIIDPGCFCAELNCTDSSRLCFHIKHPLLSKIDRKEALQRKAKSTESVSLSQALMTRTMSRKTRCILAYTLAKSVWQYYGSDWMKYPWTRENIHLLDDESVRRGDSSSSYLFRPYFATDFLKDQRGISEYADGEMHWHRYPKILALGILLIEVAKGQPFEVPKIPLDYSRDSINTYFKSAIIALKNEGLFGKKEDDFDSYRDAVEGCLKFDRFLGVAPASEQPWSEKNDNGLEKQRAIIYRKIVRPLKELLRGTRWLAGTCDMEHDPNLPSTTALNGMSAISETTLIHPILEGQGKDIPRNLNSRSRLLHGKAR